MNVAMSHTPLEARDFIVEELRRRLIGPSTEDEILSNRAYDTYHMGFLTPAGTLVDKEEDDQDGADSEPETGAGEAVMTLANLSQQSAMGISFQVDPYSTSTIFLIARWAEYVPVETPEACKGETTDPELSVDINEEMKAEPEKGAKSRPARAHLKWKRVQIEKRVVLPPAGEPIPETTERGVQILILDRVRPEARIVTFSLVNRRGEGVFPDDHRIYQVELIAESADRSAAFVARPPSSYVLDDEYWSYELLYRHRREMAIGHGCSVDWETEDGRSARLIRSQWLPQVEVRKADTTVLEGSHFLELDYLADEGQRQEICDALDQLATAYESWILLSEKEIENAVKEFSAIHHDSVLKICVDTIEACRRTSRRVRSGINCLRTQDLVWESFCLANRAMSLGMRQSRGDQRPCWRAFQLAFILVCLPSTVELGHDERKVLDLIWFPTGGGKTEAYLGLAAVAVFHRRLAASNELEYAGTTVLTRYTLRLLTIQQYERAARMVCACELIRNEDVKRLGTLPFTCGLFVGGNATPNTMKEAAEILAEKNSDTGSATTLPLSVCPWCGTELRRSLQKVVNGRLLTPCPSAKCPFHTEIPIAIVDEQIYSEPPTMVVGTIDKFARMAWEPRVSSLFGGNGSLPPSLIIQDELHLISDSLGTLAALYETAIDHLCTREGSGPKIVGSTATIRRAEGQCWRLFGRTAEQFPPNGLLADDSFFYRNDTKHPGRLYVGIHAQGRSPKHTLAWTIGCLAQSAMPQYIPDERIRDPFHTQVIYFNSLRELGGALVMAEDDVPRFLKSVVPDNGPPRRTLHHIKELTGQVPSSQIKEMLRDLGTSLCDDNLDREPFDLVFSTNMISVGIDVDRLGLMVVNGQPKTTSEYIQATSRIGRPRGSAGLAVTLYNWTRPRDRSHYERFTAYHQSFYRYVESVSVTPFSARSRDKALHAVLVALSRLQIPELSSTPSSLSSSIEVLQQVRNLAEAIFQRAKSVDNREAEATRNHLDRIITEWLSEAEQHGKSLQWSKHPTQHKVKAMLRNPESANAAHGVWKALHSMRDVQAPASVQILSKSQIDNYH